MLTDKDKLKYLLGGYLKGILDGEGRKALSSIDCGFDKEGGDYYCTVEATATQNDPAPMNWNTYEDWVDDYRLIITYYRRSANKTNITVKTYPPVELIL